MFAMLGGCAVGFAASPIDAALTTLEKRDLQREGRLIVELLQNYQYADRQVQDLDAREIVDHYLKALDPGSWMLTSDEVDFLHRRFDTQLKAYLLKGDMQPAYEIFDYFRERAIARLAWAEAKLTAGFELTTDETALFVPNEKATPAADRAEADRRWEHRLKSEVIAAVIEGRESAAALRHVGEEYRRWRKQLDAMDAGGVREAFLDVFVGMFDPHSGYFSAASAMEFQIKMRGSVGGAGLAIRMDEGHCLVETIFPGGPSEAEGSLQKGDELVAVADGDGAWVGLAGKHARQVLALLRGKSGSRLRIAYASPPADTRRELTLIRKNVLLINDRARGIVFQVPTGTGVSRCVGWLVLPSFYAAEADSDSSSLTRDVREILEQMKQRQVEAVVVDLRHNPGGAMTEAIKFTGLFVPSGTVLLTRSLDGRIEEQKVTPAEPLYDGPLIVLVSHESASASEIVAGALRFHRRALVVGAASTYGKGTAQDYLDLNRGSQRPAGEKSTWGTLRLTVQRFYFPDGRSPQGTGVESEIVLPVRTAIGFKAEADLPHALPAESISWPGAEPAPGGGAHVDDALIAALKACSAKRMAALPEFALEQRREDLSRAWAMRPTVSLNLKTRIAEGVADDAQRAKWLEDRRALMADGAFLAEPVDTQAVRDVLARHAGLARIQRRHGVDPHEGWLRAGTFFREDASGNLSEFRVGDVAFREFEPQSDRLAAAFTQAAGGTASAGQLGTALRALAVLERPTDEAVLSVFASLGAAGAIDSQHVRRGAEAVLRTVVAIEPALVDPQLRLDLPGRESLRLAADWAARLPAATISPAAAGDKTGLEATSATR